MARIWLKPFGDSTENIRDDWANEFLPDPREVMKIMTGAERPGALPRMRPGDRVVLHAVGFRRTFAAGRLVSPARRRSDRHSRWSVEQWPWTYDCEIDVWVPLVSGGPLTWDLAPRVKGHVSFGAPYSELRTPEYDRLLAALRGVLQARFRPGSVDDRARDSRIAEIRTSGRRLALPELDAALRRRSPRR